MKYDTPNQWYLLNSGKFEGWVVRPFNAEIEKFNLKGKDVNDVSWSHGFTHCKDLNGDYVMFCGVNRFEELATECADPNDINFNFDTEENNMNDLTPEQQQIVNRVSQDATAVESLYGVVYRTDDGATFTTESAVDSYNAFIYILDTVDPELLRATMAAYFEELHGD
jgi:hypothetical protein